MPAVRFLTSLAQALSTMTLYGAGHPARERAVDANFERLQALLGHVPNPQFSFLGSDVVFGSQPLRELGEWEWGARLAGVGVQRLELSDVGRDEYEAFLDDVLARLTLLPESTSAARPERPSAIRFGAVGIRGTNAATAARDATATATIAYTLHEEAEAVEWMHEEVGDRGHLPLAEAEAVVRSLSVAMHGEGEVVIPLVQLREFDEYTTTHSLNVAVLAMALAEFIGLGARDVRAFGVAGLLHDLGKVRIPKEILTKPGKLTDEEWVVMRRHPVDGARLILEGDRRLDLAAAVAYEHHIMLDGGGYPGVHYCRACHQASRLVHICDVYDALRTKRPYRDAWDADRTLAHIEAAAGNDFDPELVRAFTQMMRKWERRTALLEEEPPAPQPAPQPAAAAQPAAHGAAGATAGAGPEGTPPVPRPAPASEPAPTAVPAAAPTAASGESGT